MPRRPRIKKLCHCKKCKGAHPHPGMGRPAATRPVPSLPPPPPLPPIRAPPARPPPVVSSSSSSSSSLSAPAAASACIPELTALLRSEQSSRAEPDRVYFAGLRLGRGGSAVDLRLGRFVYVDLPDGAPRATAPLYVAQLRALYADKHYMPTAAESVDRWADVVRPALVYAKFRLYLRPEQVIGAPSKFYAPAELLKTSAVACVPAAGCIVRACEVLDKDAARALKSDVADTFFAEEPRRPAPAAVGGSGLQEIASRGVVAEYQSPVDLSYTGFPTDEERHASPPSVRATAPAVSKPARSPRRSARLQIKRGVVDVPDRKTRAENERKRAAEVYVTRPSDRSASSDDGDGDGDEGSGSGSGSFIVPDDASLETYRKRQKTVGDEDDADQALFVLSDHPPTSDDDGEESGSGTSSDFASDGRSSTARVPPGSRTFCSNTKLKGCFVLYMRFIVEAIVDPAFEARLAHDKLNLRRFRAAECRIDARITGMRDMVAKSEAWKEDVLRDLYIHPFCMSQSGFDVGDGDCLICKLPDRRARCRLLLHGPKYGSKKLWSETPDIHALATRLRIDIPTGDAFTQPAPPSGCVEYPCGVWCVERAPLFHALHHLKLQLVIAALRFVQQCEAEHVAAEKTVERMLAAVDWLSELYAAFKRVLLRAEKFRVLIATNEDDVAIK